MSLANAILAESRPRALVRMKNEQGFSLLELLIVVVVIGLIAAIATPNLLASRRAANEGSAISSLRTLGGANVTYAATTGNGSYAGQASSVGTSSLDDLAAASLIDRTLQSGKKSGFSYVGDRIPGSATELETFYFATNPSTASGLVMSGTKRFGVATDGIIRFDATFANLAIPFDAVTLAAATAVGD